MKYLKEYKIFESQKEFKSLFNRLTNAFEDTEFEIELYDNSGNDVVIRDINDGGDYYSFAEDYFTEEDLRAEVENNDPDDFSDDAKDSVRILNKIILNVLDGPKTGIDWWIREVDGAENKQLAIMKENIAKNPGWILKKEEIERFFQDSIDDVQESDYEYDLTIKRKNDLFIPQYYLEFTYHLELGKAEYAKSLVEFSKLLGTIYRGVRRIESEDLDLNITTNIIADVRNMSCSIMMFSKRDILSGKIIAVDNRGDFLEDDYSEEGSTSLLPDEGNEEDYN